MIPDERRLSIDSNLVRQPVSCPFQIPCWKNIRSPLAKKGYVDDEGIRRRLFLPYVCSNQREGDLEACSWYHKFSNEQKRDVVDDAVLSTDGVS